MKKVILSIISVAFAANVSAQTVNVHFKNGQKIEFPSSTVDYVDFSVKAADPTVSAGQVVDLGLSVYWASCNLGAEKPEEYGEYYAWGETKPKSSYTKENYSYYNASTTLYTDIGNDISGTQYDAATVNLGSDWRMPTKDEMQELIDNCIWEWTQINGINGYKATSKINNNSIFLPAAGKYYYYNGTIIIYKNEDLEYWTANNYNAEHSYFVNKGILSTGRMYWTSKCDGQSIRPVTSNPNAGGTPTDHSQDHLVTDKVTASFLGGAYTSINGKIQAGSQLNVRFNNGSSEAVTLVKIQLGDAATGSEGNNMLNEEVEVNAGEAKGYTVTVGTGGLTTPIIRFTYRYNKKNYTAEATWNL